MSHALFKLLDDLDAARIHYVLARYRPDSIIVTITFVGERVEATVFSDGHIEVSRFTGTEAAEESTGLLQKLIDNERN